jgi:hypothetical protein
VTLLPLLPSVMSIAIWAPENRALSLRAPPGFSLWLHE